MNLFKKFEIKGMLQSLLRSAFLVLIPFFLLTGFNDYFARLDHEARVDEELQNIYKVLSSVSAQGEPLALFDGIFKALAELPYPSNVFDQRLSQVIKSYGQAIDLYFFDQSGKCFPVDGLPMPPRYVAQKFLESMQSPASEAKNKKFLVQLSGYTNAPGKIAAAVDSVISIGTSHDNHWGGWFRLFDGDGLEKGSFLVFIKKSPLNFDLMLEKALKKANQKYGRSLIFAWNDPAKGDTLESDHPFLPQAAVEAVKRISRGESRFEFAMHYGLKIVTRSGTSVFAMTAQEVGGSPVFQKFRLILNISAIIAFIATLSLFSGFTSLKFGLKSRLAALFMFAAVVPLITLIFTGIADRVEREKLIVNDLQQTAIRELTRIDESMTYDFRKLEMLFRESVKKVSNIAMSEFDRELKALGENIPENFEPVRHMHVVTPDWEKTYFRKSNTTTSSKSNDTMVLYGKMLLEQIRGEYIEPESQGGVTDLQSVVNNMGGWLAKGLIMNCRRIGMLRVLDSTVPTYVDFFIDNNEFARAVSLIMLSRSGLQTNFLLQFCRMVDEKARPDGARFAAMPIERSAQWPAFPRRSVAQTPVLQKIAEQALKSGIPAHLLGEVAGKRYLLSANMAKHIDGYILIYATPYHLIEKQLQIINRRMVFLALIFLFLAFIAARLTSHFLLSPIEKLENGLQAVSSGNFRLKLEPGGVEEFSSMAVSLNQTLEGLQELHIAKNIQETLWPQKQLRGKDWDLYGRCITASELGGDYFDWKSLADGRILIIIGDVTGHGIAPAMVQAAIKVWVSMYADKVKSSGELVKEISMLHFKYGARRLYMTCWLAFYNPENGLLDYSAAGHPYPFLLRADGSIDRLQLQGIPLGVRGRCKVIQENIQLMQGDSLVLFTDGIVEKTNIAGKMLDFDGFEKLCRNSAGMAPESAVNFILEQSRLWGPQNDDETVIVLKKTGKAD